MKNKIIVSLLFAAVLFVASCQKENRKDGDCEFSLETIRAISEAIGEPAASKIKVSERFAVLWQAKDKIYVTDGENYNFFSLVSGEGETQGTFKQDNPAKTFSGTVKAYYPGEIAGSTSLVWPATQTTTLTMPMYSTKKLSGSDNEAFNFSNLGGIMQIIFNTGENGITLTSIEISDEEKPLSGAFTIDDEGKAVIISANGGNAENAGITLDLGGGVSLGRGVHYFNVAVPAGNYEDLTFRFKDTTIPKYYAVEELSLNVAQNGVGKIYLTADKFASLVESVTLDRSEMNLNIGDKSTLTATVLPKEFSDKSVTWSSDKPYVAVVDGNGQVTATGVGTAKITATSFDGEKSASCTVNVDMVINTGSSSDTYGYHYYYWIQIGDGTKWATENIQTTLDYDLSIKCDSYFSYGVTAPHYYQNDQWKNTDGSTFTGGFSVVNYPGGSIIQNEDIATANWGPNWRLPNIDEFNALMSATYCAIYGGKLLVFKPKEGDAGRFWDSENNYSEKNYPEGDILLSFPLSGYGEDANIIDRGENGYYWLGGGAAACAKIHWKEGISTGYSHGKAHCGYCVRPVTKHK